MRWPVSAVAPDEFRLRVAYRKAGRLRFLSHLEVARAHERAARRAGMPYAVSLGFTPRIKVAFGPALPVGTAGEREYLDLTLREYVPAATALRRLIAATPEGLAPAEARYMPAALPSLAAALTIARYEVALNGVGAEQLTSALGEIVASGELAVEHKGKTKVFDLARSLPEEARVVADGGRCVVNLTTRMGPEGSLRPEVLLRSALDRLGILVAPASVTRTDAFVETEGGWARPL